MLPLISIICVSIVIAWFDAPKLLKEKQVIELIVFFILLTIGMTVSALLVLRINIPNPIEWLIEGVSPLSSWYTHTF